MSILGGGQYLFPNPKPLEKRLKDMLEDNVDEKFYLSATAVSSFLKSTFTQERDRLNTKDIAKTLCARDAHGPQLVSEPVIAASRGRNPDNPSDRTVGIPTEQRLEVKYDGCTNTLTSVQKDNYVIEPKVIQVGNIVDSGNWDNPQRGRVYSSDGCSPALNTCQGGGLEPKITEGYRIRKLTPRECWRLMGVKDEQFDRLHGISNSQLYKLAGNSIVVDVLEAIFKNLLMPETTDTKGQLSLF